MFAADRGYSCLELWEFIATHDTGFVMVTKTGNKVGHPFVSQSKLTESEQDLEQLVNFSQCEIFWCDFQFELQRTITKP